MLPYLCTCYFDQLLDEQDPHSINSLVYCLDYYCWHLTEIQSRQRNMRAKPETFDLSGWYPVSLLVDIINQVKDKDKNLDVLCLQCLVNFIETGINDNNELI